MAAFVDEVIIKQRMKDSSTISQYQCQQNPDKCWIILKRTDLNDK